MKIFVKKVGLKWKVGVGLGDEHVDWHNEQSDRSTWWCKNLADALLVATKLYTDMEADGDAPEGIVPILTLEKMLEEI
tara:strand:+ start:4740 stop:4973 length:234 start_codon:yes stop_codon:yes gene_type:complete